MSSVTIPAAKVWRTLSAWKVGVVPIARARRVMTQTAAKTESVFAQAYVNAKRVGREPPVILASPAKYVRMETASLVMIVGAEQALLATNATVQGQNSKKWSQQARQLPPPRC